MSPTVMVDLLIGQGFLRETQARKLDLDILAQKYWTAPSSSPQLTADPPSILLIPTASEFLIQYPSKELQMAKQEFMAHSHHTIKGMKKKLAYDLMCLAICIEKVETLGKYKIPCYKISLMVDKVFSLKQLNWAKGLKGVSGLLQGT